MDQFASYEGTSGFLRWWPKALIGFALVLVAYRWNHSLQWATLLVVAAWLHGRLLPWRFEVLDDGLNLTFPFGRRVFLPKGSTVVRIENVGAVALFGGHRHIGYLLHDGVLYVPDQRTRLRRALNFYGYRVV